MSSVTKRRNASDVATLANRPRFQRSRAAVASPSTVAGIAPCVASSNSAWTNVPTHIAMLPGELSPSSSCSTYFRPQSCNTPSRDAETRGRSRMGPSGCVQSNWNHQRDGSSPRAMSPSRATRRSAAGAWVSAKVRRQRAAASEAVTGSPNGGRGAGSQSTSRRNRERAERASASCTSAAVHSTSRRARARTMLNSRRSSSSRSRVRVACVCGPESAPRSNIGSRRAIDGKLPSTAPTTTTVSNSRPAAP